MCVFKDYYAILGVNRDSSYEEIRTAYRALSKRWHPDMNHGVDTTVMMQDINEAYSVLKDNEKRKRYDVEYERYRVFISPQSRYCGEEYDFWRERSYESDEYEVKDERVRRDINEAREYAKRIVEEFMRSLKMDLRTAAKGVWLEVKIWLLVLAVMAVIGFICLIVGQ